MRISFSPPDITQSEIDEVVKTLKSGWITTGPKTKQFEKEIASYCGTKRAVCLNSATAAMELVLRFLGIGEGDEVITTAYTYSASASVIRHAGAKIVLVDIEKDTLNFDAAKLEAAITARTKAIIPVDIGGMITDYDAVYKAIESKREIFSPTCDRQQALGRIAVIADSAHSLGSEKDGKISGTIADFTCFSFHAVKNLTTAEGGAITWTVGGVIPDSEIYNEFMLLSLHGQNKDAMSKLQSGDWRYDICGLYYKCNMTDIAAALGISQLRRYGEMLKRRRELVRLYNSLLSDTTDIILPEHFAGGNNSNGHLYMTRIEGADEERRDRILTYLAGCGISCNVHYMPLPMFTAYKKLGFDIEDYGASYEYYKNELTLPLHSLLTDRQVEYVAEKFKEALKNV